MQYLSDLADDRLIDGCIYCGGKPDTREHVPSRILLNKPFPENLPVMPACADCNQSYSMDEEYVACVIGCMMSGTTMPNEIKDERVSKTLNRKPNLRAAIENSKSETDSVRVYRFDEKRLLNVLIKLAKGHSAFELGHLERKAPDHYWWDFKKNFSKEEWESFDIAEVTNLLGEIGSRNFQRMYVVEAPFINSVGESETTQLIINDWVDVQEDVYRYQTIDNEDGVTIRIIIREFIAFEAFWRLA